MTELKKSFWDKLDIKSPSECWEWNAAKDSSGYGRFGTKDRAHRLIYSFLGRKIPSGYEVHHLCRNRACANPWHLEAVPEGTHKKIQRLEAPIRLYCKNGHFVVKDNLYLRPKKDGTFWRTCRKCAEERLERHKNRHGV